MTQHFQSLRGVAAGGLVLHFGLRGGLALRRSGSAVRCGHTKRVTVRGARPGCQRLGNILRLRGGPWRTDCIIGVACG